MKNELFAAATAMMFVAVSPAFATSPEEQAAHDQSVYPPGSECHFLKDRVVLPNGHVVFLTHQGCN
jgi:hypothetical protein